MLIGVMQVFRDASGGQTVARHAQQSIRSPAIWLMMQEQGCSGSAWCRIKAETRVSSAEGKSGREGRRTFSSVYVMLRLGTVCMFSSAACLHQRRTP